MDPQSVRQILSTIDGEVYWLNIKKHGGDNDRLTTIHELLLECDRLIADYRYEVELKNKGANLESE